jgi:hypothetical protein
MRRDKLGNKMTEEGKVDNQEKPSVVAKPMTLSAVGEAGGWLGTIRSSVKQKRERLNGRESDSEGDMLDNVMAKMLTHFQSLGVFVDLDWEAWENEAARYANDIDTLKDADLLTLRRLITYHGYKGGILPVSEDWVSRLHSEPLNDYWLDLAMNGHLLRILSRFQNIYAEVANRTLV